MGRIVTLHNYSAWGQGNHVQACIDLLKGMVGAGGEVHLDLPRTLVDMGEVPHRASIPWPVNRFGIPQMEPMLVRAAQTRFLARLREGDIAWVWPDAPEEVFEGVKRKGVPVLLERINTRVAEARAILAGAHAAEGLEPNPEMTDDKVRADEMALSHADYAFAASPAIEASLRAEGSAFRGRILPTSYGAWMPGEIPVREGVPEGRPVTVLFVGTLSVRKNVHGLLRAWAKADTGDARLTLVGPLSLEIETICARELTLPSVDLRNGYFPDLAPFYRAADVFVIPSLEEGDPQVTYLAAGHGLPIVASPMGGGRMAAATDAILVVDPDDGAALADALTRMIADPALRAEHAARVRAAAPRFDWRVVGKDRLEQIRRIM